MTERTCVGCPAFKYVCRINRWEIGAINRLKKSKKYNPLPEDIVNKVAMIMKNSDTEANTRLMAYEARKHLDCHINTIHPIIADPV